MCTRHIYSKGPFINYFRALKILGAVALISDERCVWEVNLLKSLNAIFSFIAKHIKEFLIFLIISNRCDKFMHSSIIFKKNLRFLTKYYLPAHTPQSFFILKNTPLRRDAHPIHILTLAHPYQGQCHDNLERSYFNPIFIFHIFYFILFFEELGPILSPTRQSPMEWFTRAPVATWAVSKPPRSETWAIGSVEQQWILC